MRLKIPPVIVFLLSLGIAFGIYYLTKEYSYNYPYKTLLSRIPLVSGALIALAGIAAFRLRGTTTDPTKPEKASTLVTNGIYMYTRNPMYFGMLLVLIGGIIRIGNPFCILSAIFFVLYMNKFQIRPEEGALKNLFPNEYPEYLKKVRRWI
ncbi:methyltransferase family protein [Ekhidna sp.]